MVDFIDNSKAMELVKEELNRVLSGSPVIVRKYTEHLKLSSGKFIRAAALLACAENRQSLVNSNAIKFAAAIELLHLATLVHDDVIDDAGLRRGVITLQKKFGRRTAVICGDYLLCMALEMAASISDKEDYLSLNMPDYMSRVCLGELNQHVNNGYLDLTIRQYFKIISGKTAALFEASFFGGAILSEDNEAALIKYRKLGRYIGMIFQMTDDCIDFETTESVAKKPVQSDYEQGVITLPLIFTLKRMQGFKEMLKSGRASRQDINTAVAGAGGLDLTRMVVRKYYNKSMVLLNDMDLTDSKKEKLMAILNKASRIS